MNGFERRKRQKTEQIFGAAIELFARHGFRKVSVNEIAQRAQVSPATIYNYFETKERLYADLLVHWVDKQIAEYERILESERPFPEKTEEILQLEARNLQLLSDELPQASASEADGLTQRIDSYSRARMTEFAMKFVAAGKREGFIHPNHPEEMVALYFNMYADELSRYWATPHRERAPGSQLGQWVELFFYGLAGRTQGREPR